MLLHSLKQQAKIVTSGDYNVLREQQKQLARAICLLCPDCTEVEYSQPLAIRKHNGVDRDSNMTDSSPTRTQRCPFFVFYAEQTTRDRTDVALEHAIYCSRRNARAWLSGRTNAISRLP
jgi:hypothetical protein